MQIPYLEEQILFFVRRLICVEKWQILKFFSDHDHELVNRSIATLEYTQQIFPMENGRYAGVRGLASNQYDFEATIRAVSVMCELHSGDVRWFCLDEYPSSLLFITNDNKAFDVTVFDGPTWATKYALVNRFRTRGLPDSEDDPIYHIAAVPSMEILRKIEPLGWSMYALIQSDASVQLLSPDET